MNSKNIVIVIIVLVLVGALTYLFTNGGGEEVAVNETDTNTEQPIPTEPDEGIGDGAEPLTEQSDETMDERGESSVLGTSVGGRTITASHFGTGETELLIVGGTHGGYSPNTTALAEEAIEYFTNNPTAVPEGVMVTIIPTLNPDGATLSGTPGRFNSNDVDLNRNFDCEWSATGVWRDQEVSGGAEPFSEPEANALRQYVDTYSPNHAIVLFAAEGKVYPSACASTPSNASVELAATYATAAGYPAEAEFDAYAITGDMVNWMAKEGIPAISVLLSDRQSSEWTKNQAGIEAVLELLAQ
tara:strand:- start:3595 stop:4494 length:900 start_codon:yes stop_codon:yes gene_type:complete